MGEFLTEYGLFLAKAVTLVVAIIVVVGAVVSIVREAREQLAEQLEVKNLNQRYEQMADVLRDELLDDAEQKARRKQKKKDDKAAAKAAKAGHAKRRPKLFVLDFNGDIRASDVDNLREEISAVLQVAENEDEVLLRLESSGGLVHTYGLAASQLRRLRDHGIRLVAAIDEVAASGGYLMASVADRILAAPFAIVGSIGVVAQLPNFNRWLKAHNIDFELHTAGDHKRTLTLFGENNEHARAKFQEELEDTHKLFQEFLTEHRPSLEVSKVATGEHWFGTRALKLKLIDEIKTSDDYLLEAVADNDIYSVKYKVRKPLAEKLGHAVNTALRSAGPQWPWQGGPK